MSATVAKYSLFLRGRLQTRLLVESYQMPYYVSETLWDVHIFTFWWPMLTYYIHNPQVYDPLSCFHIDLEASIDYLSFQAHIINNTPWN